MSASVQEVINDLAARDFVVEASGGRYTIAHGGEIIFRQGSAREFLIFAGGMAVAFEISARMIRRSASIERALENSPAHQAALRESASSADASEGGR